MDRPRVGGVQLVDWCTRRPSHRAIKTRSCFRLHPWKAHAWEVLDWWTGAFVDQLIEPKNQELFRKKSATKNIGASICNGREIWCLPYAGFFLLCCHSSLPLPQESTLFSIWRPALGCGTSTKCSCETSSPNQSVGHRPAWGPEGAPSPRSPVVCPKEGLRTTPNLWFWRLAEILIAAP